MFRYDNPPQIDWGPGCAARVADEAGQRIFLVTSRSVDVTPVERLLAGRICGRFAHIGQHAPIEGIRQAAAAAREAAPDVLLSVGGGSVIDATKAVAFMLATGSDLAGDTRGLEPETLPHLAIPTTLSAAEMDGAAGFTLEGNKVGVRAKSLIPRAVFYDAAIAVRTPLDLWLSTGIRAVDHAVEALLAPENNPLSEAASLEALRRLAASLPATKKDPAELSARTEAQIGAWLSMTIPLASARGLSHTLGKQIGARHGIPHGVTSCLLLPHVLRALGPRPELSRVPEALGRPHVQPADAVAALIEALELPRHLGAYGLSEQDLRAAAEPVARRFHRPVEELIAIYRAAW